MLRREQRKGLVLVFRFSVRRKIAELLKDGEDEDILEEESAVR